MNERDPHKAIDYIITVGDKYAKAKSQRVQLSEFRKSKKALLIQQAPPECKTVQDKECFAYAHAEYIQLLDDIGSATYLEEKYRMGIKAAEARVEVWRTECSNNRAEFKTGSLVT